eukprot:Nk52_evm1s644 gene=Nk52_evmTU1s644
MADKEIKLPLQEEDEEVEGVEEVGTSTVPKKLIFKEENSLSDTRANDKKLNASEIIRRARSKLDAIAGTSINAQRAQKLKEIEKNLDLLENEAVEEEEDEDYEVVSSVALVSAPPPPPREKDSKENKKPPNTYIDPFNPKTTPHPMVWLDTAIETLKQNQYSSARVPYGLTCLLEGEAKAELLQENFRRGACSIRTFK